MNADLPEPPPGHLRRTAWARAEFASLDFEATGLDFDRDTIISFGVVPVRAGRALLAEAVYQLVEPEVPPTPKSVTVHGLRVQDLAGSPPLEEAKETLRAALAGRFLVTWWAEVEAAFLDKIYGGGSRRWFRRSIDVRRLVIALDRRSEAPPRSDRYTLSATADRFGVPVASAHHALDDALVTAQLFLILASHLAPHGYRTVRDFLRETRTPATYAAGVRGPR